MKKSPEYLNELRKNEYLKSFVFRLIELRTQRGWSQVKLSKEAGFNLNRVNEIENFTVMPSLDTVCKLADALEINAGDFFYPKNS